MAQIVFAAGAPHAPAIVGLFDKAPDDSRKVVTDTYAAITNELRAAKPDVLIAFANDHLANSRITFYPDFLIGTAAKHSGPHEWFQEWIGCRDYTAKGNPAVAKSLFAGMTRRGMRMTVREENLKFDDNISVPVTMTDLDKTDITLVPVLQNCTVPPFPDAERCFEVGHALRDFIEKDLPGNARGAVRLRRPQPRTRRREILQDRRGIRPPVPRALRRRRPQGAAQGIPVELILPGRSFWMKSRSAWPISKQRSASGKGGTVQFCSTGTRVMSVLSRSVIVTGTEMLSSNFRFSSRTDMRTPRRVMPWNSDLATAGLPLPM